MSTFLDLILYNNTASILTNDHLGVKPIATDMESYWTIKPKVLIIAPTRELCTQIAREAAKFVFNTDIKIANIYGGSNIRIQRKHACQAHILSCTVGRLKVIFSIQCKTGPKIFTV